MNLSKEIIDQSVYVAQFIIDNEMLTGKKHSTIAGVAIYVALDGQADQLQFISGALDIGEQAIRSAYNTYCSLIDK